MVFLSVSDTNSFHLLCLARLSSRLYSLCLAFHSLRSVSFLVRRNRFLFLLASFRSSVRFSFHQHLLNGDGFFLGVESSIASCIALVISFAKVSSSVGVLGLIAGGRDFWSFSVNSFQFVLS